MKTKIYWRLAVLLSFIPLLIWTIVLLVNGSISGMHTEELSLKWINNIYHMFPTWILSRWWDVPGMFLIVIFFQNLSLRKIWDKNPKGYLQGWLYALVVILLVIGIILGLVMMISFNLLFAFVVFVVGTVIVTVMLYVIQQIPVDWQKRAGRWIMQKDKE